MANPIAPESAATVIGYLNSKSLTATAYGKIPETRPDTFIRVINTGGAGRTQRVIHRAIVIVECWAANQDAASTLAATVDALVFDMADDGIVYAVRPVAAFAFLPDPTSKQDRYTATYEIVSRAV